ncbi:hypothetical protein [Virgisporangium aurantiacum]|uniref:Uncharacterized protein n=1 Tax=Virgisporangium aurantiacum TaxID=175570 RepID=A0A8J3ZIL0_9ACTN|nr:hypothetical protein [Virgisporangium aurantiacum]GIJ64559.1 hypothetical protein Vau01_120750 [Virgisporangium aurantiacum]
MSNLYQFHHNDPGAALNVRVIDPGDRCGPLDRHTHDGPEPLIEFFDARHPDTSTGQFIASYRQSVVMDVNGGLALRVGEPTWTATAWVMGQLQRILVERWWRFGAPTPTELPPAAGAPPGARAVTVSWFRAAGDMTYAVTRWFYRNRHELLRCLTVYEVRDCLGHPLASTTAFTAVLNQRMSANDAARAAMPAANPEWNARMLPDWPA